LARSLRTLYFVPAPPSRLLQRLWKGARVSVQYVLDKPVALSKVRAVALEALAAKHEG